MEPGGEGFRAAAQALVNYLLEQHWNGKALLRTVNDQGGFGEASLGDYAWVAWGMDEWSRIANDARAASLVGTLLETAWREFHDSNGWRSSQAAILPGMPAVEAQEDGALPAPTARIYRLSLGGASENLRRKAEETLPAVRKRVQGDPFWYASHLALFLGGRDASGGGTAKPGTVNQ